MKVALISSYDVFGGAAIACYRLFEALKNNTGHDIELLVDRRYSADENVTPISDSFIANKASWLRFGLERLYFLSKARSRNVLYQFSPAIIGTDISRHPMVQQADVLHLHWINFGFLSLSSLQQLIALNKPIVWTLHDMWAFTGGCHYSLTCTNYERTCGNCPYLKKPNSHDLSVRILAKKKRIFAHTPITFVTCSQWLAKEARKSSLLSSARITTINNPINLDYFKPVDKVQARKRRGLDPHKFYVSFGAANVEDERKGLIYLQKALQIFSTMVFEPDPIELLVFGKSPEDIFSRLPFRVHRLGKLSDSHILLDIYNASDVFVLPSLQDNLPNTLLEAMACGVPCIGFQTGGIPEIITHQKNGFLAHYKDASSLAEGIYYIFKNKKNKLLSLEARKSSDRYGYLKIAKEYATMYEELLSANLI